MKDLFIAAHEEMIEEFLLDHPEATWDQAYEATADGAYERMKDKYASMVDEAHDRAKDERLLGSK